jgi:hypothetical protein
VTKLAALHNGTSWKDPPMGCQLLRFDIAQTRTKKPVRVADVRAGSGWLYSYQTRYPDSRTVKVFAILTQPRDNSNLLPLMRSSPVLFFFCDR